MGMRRNREFARRWQSDHLPDTEGGRCQDWVTADFRFLLGDGDWQFCIPSAR